MGLPVFSGGEAGSPNVGLLSARPVAGPATFESSFLASDTGQLFECIQPSAGNFSWVEISPFGHGNFLNKAPGAIAKIMWLGDSNTAGSNGDEAGFVGGWRHATEQKLRQWRSDFDFIGSVITVPELSSVGLWYEDGIAGTTIESQAAAFAGYVATAGVGAPDLIADSIGTNNIVAGDTAAQMMVKRATLDAAYLAAAPNAKVMVMPIIPFVQGTTTGANLAAWNATRVQYNALLQAYVAAKGSSYIFFDASSQCAVGEYQTDGVHLTRIGQADVAASIANFLNTAILGPPFGHTLPRSFKQRATAASTLCLNAADGLKSTAHPGFNPGSGSFAVAIDFYPISLPAAGTNTILNYGVYNVGTFFLLSATGRKILLYWNNAAGTITGPEESVTAEAIAVGFWQRIVLIAHAPSLTVGIYVNGQLIALKQGLPAWNFTQKDMYVAHETIFGTGLPAFYSRLNAYQGTNIPRPGSQAAKIAVEADYYDEGPIAPGNCSASFYLNTTLTDNINGNPPMVFVGGAAQAGAYPGGTTPQRPWEFGNSGPPGQIYAYAAFASLTTAVAQAIPPGSGANTSSADLVLGTIANQAGQVSQLLVQHTGAAGNVAGQTITYQLNKNGVAVTGAVIAGVATTAGVKTASVNFVPVTYLRGDVFTLTLLPSAILTTALADVMGTAS